MTHWYRKWEKRCAWAFSVGCLMLACSSPVQAEEKSEQQIIEELAQPRTRGLVAPDQARQERMFLESLRDRKTRSLTLGERKQIATIAKHSPKINLEIHFDFDSAAITPKAEPQLQSLGRALTSSKLAGATILLGGHTDARGSDSYNQELSERRADAVKKFLVERFHIPAQNLAAAGYGEQDLANKRRPYAAGNRRVQIVNLASSQEATKAK